MDKEKKRRAVYDLRYVVYTCASIMSVGAMQTITALCLKGITKKEALIRLTNDTAECLQVRDKVEEWWNTHVPQAIGFVKQYQEALIIDPSCDAHQMIDCYEGEIDLDTDVEIPIRDIYWVAKKLTWQSSYRTKQTLYNCDWRPSQIQELRVAFLNSIKYTELYRGRKKSKYYTVSRDKDAPAYYVSARGRLGKLPLYKMEKYIKEKKIVFDHNEWRATGTFTDLNELKEKAPKVNMVNISCGYYNPHTNNEYLEIEEFEYNVDRIFEMISNHPDKIVDDTPEEPKKPTQYGNYNSTGYDYNWDRYSRHYDNCDECAYCGSIVRPNEGLEDEDGNVFCDEHCERLFKKLVEADINSDDEPMEG